MPQAGVVTVFGASLGRFAFGVIAAEAIPILLLVVAMFFVGTAIGGRPSQETAAAWGSWIGPIAGTLSSALLAWWVARTGSNRLAVGVALGLAVALLDLSLTLAGTRGAPFRLLYAISALTRLAGGYVGGLLAARPSVSDS